jgi:hypothetical protein
MIQFACDSCSAVRQDDDPWIVGIAAEALGVTAARREVTLFPVWDDDRAVHSLAVHFCSVRCKNRYMERLFGPDAASDEVSMKRTGAVEAVIERVTPAKKRVTKAHPTRQRESA